MKRLLLLLVCLPATEVRAAAAIARENLETREYEVVSVSGEVMVWRSFYGAWHRLHQHDRVLSAGLIHSPGVARLVLRRRDQPESSDHLTLEMTDAIMLRIQEPLSRDLIISSMTLKQPSRSLPSGTGLANGRPRLRGLAMAWQRFKSIGDLVSDLLDDFVSLLKPARPAQSISVDLATASIDLATPADGSLFVVERLPADIPLSWTAPPASRKTAFQVFVRRREQQDPTLVLETSAQSAVVHLSHQGVQFVRVACNDRGQVSQEVMITVDAP